MTTPTSSSSNLLTRFHSSSSSSTLTPTQQVLDSTGNNFTHHAADPLNLLSMTAASFAFRFGKLAVLEGAAATGLARIAPRFAINGAASVFGLGVEVTAFRGSSNLLNGNSLAETFEANGWKSSFADFALLKSMGRVGGNPVLTNLAQSNAMVLGRNLSAEMGWVEKDSRSYVERLAEAQATTFALSAGQALLGTLSGGRIQVAEKILETRLSSLESTHAAFSPELLSPLGARSAELLSMGAQAESTALDPQSPRNKRPDSGKHKMSRTGRVWRGIANNVLRLVPDFDINFRVNPERPVPPPPTRRPVEAIRSVQEGMDRARIAGHDRETLSFLRWGADQLRHQPEVRHRFFQDMQNLFQVQQKLRNLWEPILAKLPRPNLEGLNQKARTYLNRLAALASEGNHYYAEHLVLRARLAELNLRTRDDYARLSDSPLRERGIEPEAIESIGRNAHAFSRAEIEARLDHPLLKSLPEAAALREAYDTFQRELEAFNTSLQEAEGSMAGLRSRIATTSDVERRASLEREIKAIAAPFNREYWVMTGKVNDAMKGFLSDPVLAKIFLVQNAYHTSLRTAVLGMSPRQMATHLRTQETRLTGEQAELAKSIRAAAEGLELVGDRGFVARSFYAALRFFNKDPLSPQVLRRRYELALSKMVEETSPAFWNLPQPEAEALREAVEAQTSYFKEYDRVVDESRRTMAELEAQNQAFWQSFDQEMRPLILRDLERQLEQANGHIEALRKKIGDDFEDRGTSRNESYAAEHVRLQGKAQEAMEALRQANADTKINSRDLNRKREAALQRVQDLFTFANRIQKRESKILQVAQSFGVRFSNGNGKNGSQETPLVPVSALAMPYVTKFQSRWYRSLGESLRVLGPLVWQTLPRVVRLINAVKRGHSFTTLQSVFADWASEMARSRGDIFVVNPHTDAITELTTSQFAGKHAGWPDFAMAPTPGAGIAQRAGQGGSADTPLILAKDGLGRLMGPLFATAIDMLAEGVGDSSKQFDKSVSRAARSLTMGDAGNASLRPSNTAAYDELTMTVINLISPYRFSPFESTSEIISLPQGGRSFRIADRAMALSSRAQNLLLTVSLNSNTMYPKPDRPLPIRRTRMTTVTDWLPAQALGGGMGGVEADSASWLRTRWYEMATVPEYRTVTPSVRKIFAPFEKPVDASVEQTLEQMFGGVDGVYPNAEVSRHLRKRAETIHASESLQASQRYDVRLIETHLNRALLELKALAKDRALPKESAELAESIERRKAHLAKLSWKLDHHRPLTETEQREWEALRESAMHPEQSARVWQILELSQAFQRNLPDSAPPALVKLLNQRIQQVQLALARSTLGERLTPAEELLLQEIEAALTGISKANPVADRVFTTLRQPSLERAEIDSLVTEENIREETRRLAQLLPGGGRGSIDVIEESAHDHARVIQNEAGNIVGGPRSLLRTLHQAARFVAHCMQLGFGEASVDLVTGNHWNLYTAHSAFVGRSIMAPMQWRPAVDANTLRTIEDLRIQAKKEKRPIVIGSTHESWTDIVTIMSLIPEARFNAKFELVFTGVLTPPLLGGRHNLITRGNPEKAKQQMERAGRRMLKYGVATANFHGGTRSKTGTVSPGKKGTGYLIVDTNALALVLTLHGTQQVMPLSWGSLLSKGGGTHRRVDLRASVIDYKNLVDQDAAISAEQQRKRSIHRVNDEIQNRLIEQELSILDSLHTLAQQGNWMAAAQLAETMTKLEPGMALVRAGQENAALAWAEGGQHSTKDKGKKTDIEFLKQVTAWWDSVRANGFSSPQ